jgi:hypothetical protein
MIAEKQIFSEEVGKGGPIYKLEYVTGAVSLLDNDGIVVHVLNDNGGDEKARVVIYKDTGAGAVAVEDHDITVDSTEVWGLGFSAVISGEYWIRIQVSSDVLVPKVSFERHDGVWIPIVTYRPGDFAVFDLHPSRKRIW